MSTSKAGPLSYQNWLAQAGGAPRRSVSEVPLYSDAHITGELTEGLGPYVFRNGLPNDERDPAVVLFVDGHLDPNNLPRMQKTDTANFTGAWLGDEIAALCSLAFGARIMAGSVTRLSVPGSGFWTILGDSDRPSVFPVPHDRPKILPRVVETTTMQPELLASYQYLGPEQATALVRAARSYRDALWVAEPEPELSWLLLVSALEVASVQQQIDHTSPVDILRASKPKLVARLQSPELVEEVANALARELRATARFLDFMGRFAPDPPAKRPPEGFRIDWSAANLKRAMKTVYEHRSRALHEGIPFPPPMCDAPMFIDPKWDAPIETVPGLAVSTSGGVWSGDDMPFTLHSFEYIARGALLNWWRALAPTSAVEAPTAT